MMMRAHALGAVQAGQGVGVLDKAGGAAQRPPQLVHDGHVGTARGEVGQRGCGVGDAEAVCPGAQHRGGEQLVADPDPGGCLR